MYVLSLHRYQVGCDVAEYMFKYIKASCIHLNKDHCEIEEKKNTESISVGLKQLLRKYRWVLENELGSKTKSGFEFNDKNVTMTICERNVRERFLYAVKWNHRMWISIDMTSSIYDSLCFCCCCSQYNMHIAHNIRFANAKKRENEKRRNENENNDHFIAIMDLFCNQFTLVCIRNKLPAANRWICWKIKITIDVMWCDVVCFSLSPSHPSVRPLLRYIKWIPRLSYHKYAHVLLFFLSNECNGKILVLLWILRAIK